MSGVTVAVRRQRQGFTLVELLVVVGILVVLVSLLLPSLQRAREQARQVTCLSNLRQIAQAFVSYAADNDQYFPYMATVGGAQPEDWIYWQKGRRLEKSAIAPHLFGGTSNPGVLRCPSDNLDRRPRNLSPDPYRYSYTMNGLLSSKPRPDHAGARPVRLREVRQPGIKILLVEEDARTIDDGHWHAKIPVTAPLVNDLSARHDLDRPAFDPQKRTRGANNSWSDDQARGNAAFADGHGEYTNRGFTRDPKHYEPLK